MPNTKKMTPTDIQILRVKLENIIQDALETGDAYLLGNGCCYNYLGGHCLLSLVCRNDRRPGVDYFEEAGTILGLGTTYLVDLENGFEGQGRVTSSPVYQLGAYLREKYV